MGRLEESSQDTKPTRRCTAFRAKNHYAFLKEDLPFWPSMISLYLYTINGSKGNREMLCNHLLLVTTDNNIMPIILCYSGRWLYGTYQAQLLNTVEAPSASKCCIDVKGEFILLCLVISCTRLIKSHVGLQAVTFNETNLHKDLRQIIVFFLELKEFGKKAWLLIHL